MTFKNSIIYVIVISQIATALSQSKWTLVWNEEFTSDQIDSDKWKVEDEKNTCTGNYIGQLQCHTSKSRNVRVVDGVLAITATKEKHLDKEYTSGLLNAKFGFTYGRVEMRASLPNGKMLRPAIWMLPEKDTLEWPKNGQIDYLVNIQNSKISSGVHFFNNGHKYLGEDIELSNSLGINLHDFHVYELEWSKDSIKWSIDGKQYFQVNTNKKLGDIYERNGQPFDHNFQLYLQLGIGGMFFPKELVLTDEDVHKWNCSALLVDSIRIWKLNDNTDTVNKKFVTKPYYNTVKSANSICSKIMSEIDPSRGGHASHHNHSEPNKSSSKSMISNFLLFLLICILAVKTL